EQVPTGATRQRVIPGATKQVRARQRAVALVQRDRVVSSLSKDLDQAGIGDRGGAARYRHGAAVDEDLSRRVSGSHDRVVETVSEYRQHTRIRSESSCNSHLGLQSQKQPEGIRC